MLAREKENKRGGVGYYLLADEEGMGQSLLVERGVGREFGCGETNERERER